MPGLSFSATSKVNHYRTSCPHVGLDVQQTAKSVLSGLEVRDGLVMKGVQLGIVLDPDSEDCRVASIRSDNDFRGTVNETVNRFDTLESKELNIVSDRQFKTDVDYLCDIVETRKLVSIMHAMRVYRYSLEGTEATQLGVMADEYYRAICPVLKEKQNQSCGKQYQTVNYNHVLMLLLANTQRLECRVSELERIVDKIAIKTEGLDSGVERPPHGDANVIAPDVVTHDGEVQTLEAFKVLRTT